MEGACSALLLRCYSQSGLLLELGLPRWGLGVLLIHWCHSRRRTTFKWCSNDRTARAHYLWLREQRLSNDKYVLSKLEIVEFPGRTTLVAWINCCS